MLQTSPLVSLSPSFTSYSSSTGNLADIAARVVDELRRENSDMFLLDDDDEPWLGANDHEPADDENDDGEFEFAVAGIKSPAPAITADEIFHNGQILPVYPLFGKSLLDLEATKKTDEDRDRNDEIALAPAPARKRQPLRKLMWEEEWSPSSCSSSEADELEGLPSGTYCVWAPKKNSGDGKKSKSTGTASRRWKFRDLIVLSRTNSDGGAGKANEKLAVAAGETAEKRSVSRPYKPDIVGILANVNGLSRNLHPF